MFTLQDPAPHPGQVLSPLECLVWDVHCGLYLSERSKGPCNKVNTVTKHIQWLQVLTCRPVWPGGLAWKHAHLFLAFAHSSASGGVPAGSHTRTCSC